MTIRPYNSPGVSVIETINPALAPIVGNPSLVSIVGHASGEQLGTEKLILTAYTSNTLRYTGVDPDTVIVKNLSGNTVNAGAYFITQGEDPDPGVAGDEPYTITRAEAPSFALTASNSGSGTLTGTYIYAVSFENAQGETALSPVATDHSDTIVLASQGANLSNIPIGVSDGVDQVIARNIYRAKIVNGVTGIFHKVATIANNIDTALSNESTSDLVASGNPEKPHGINSGDTILVSYNYTSNFYYEPTLFNDYDDIVSKYGAPFNSDGTLLSELSFGAKFAFENGASEIVCLAVPDSDVDFSLGLLKLEADDPINLIVPISGETVVHESLTAHINTCAANGNYRFGIVGMDGSVNTIDPVLLRNTALGFNNEALSLISPSRFKITNPVTLQEMAIGAQYVAAAIAGMLVSRDVEVALTRKTVAGFIMVDERRTATELALDSASGLLVIEPKGGVLRVRHSITTSPTNVNTREVSVVRAKYDLIKRVRDTLDGLIGMVVPFASAPAIVASTTQGVLNQLVAEGSIVTFRNVKARQLNTDPTTIEVRFEYTPAYPINNIIVNFTISTVTGEFVVATS